MSQKNEILTEYSESEEYHATPDAVVDINRLIPESDPPKVINEEDLTDLADSIRTHGMLV